MGAAVRIEGRFVPGVSGNPGGRATLTPEQKRGLELARKAVPAAIRCAIDMLAEPEWQARAAAVKVLLDKGLPRWAVEHMEGPDKGVSTLSEHLRQLAEEIDG